MKYISPIFGAASGSLGGTVFSRNKGGNYTRARVNPTNPKSPAQTAVRAKMSQVSKAWGSLTQLVKSSYANFASDNPVKNSLGEDIFLSGFGWFAKTGFNWLNGGQPLSALVVPTTTDIVAPVIASFTADLLAGVTLTLDAAVPTGMFAVVRTKLFKTNGVTNPGRLVQTVIVPADDPAAIEVTSEMSALFGTVVVGDVVFAEVFFMSDVSGVAGSPVRAAKVVVTNTTP